MRGIVSELDPRCLGQERSRLLRRDRAREPGEQRHRVADRHRDADARRRDVEIRDPEDLPRLVDRLDLLAGGAVLGERVDLGEDVERHRLAEDVADRERIDIRAAELLHLVVQLLDLFGEFPRPVAARPRHGLIRGQDQRTEAGGTVQRRERHHRDDRRAVGDRDDLRRSLQRLGIHLGDHERHVGLHPERGRLVDADRAGRGGLANERARDGRAGGGEREVHAAERVERELPDRDLVPAERDRTARGSGRRERHQLVHRERALLQDAEHLGAHCTGRADDGDLQVPCAQPTVGPSGRSARARPAAPVPRPPSARRTRCGSATSRSSRC